MAAFLAAAGGLAGAALVGDSLTFDEAVHLPAGYSHLKLGDFRLAPETPPLAQMWAALPLLLKDVTWVPPNMPEWQVSNTAMVGREWLFRLNDGEKLLAMGRAMIVLLLLATCLMTYLAARRLFGSLAGLLALVLAALDPLMLAHGHLVTADLAATLCFLLVLMTWARFLEAMSWPRWLAAALATAALCLVKFSWPLVTPAIFVMAAIAVARRRAMGCAAPRSWQGRNSHALDGGAKAAGRVNRLLAISAAVVATAIVVWLAIWTAYGWRYSAFRAADRDSARFLARASAPETAPKNQEQAWEYTLAVGSTPRSRSLWTGLIDTARQNRLLPEGYLYGWAFTGWFSKLPGPAYFLGKVSMRGWLEYFPVAFAIKTPVATMALLAAGLWAMRRTRTRGGRESLLATGLACFAAVYFAVAVGTRFNIGLRHLLPVYPVVFIFAGAAATWLRHRVGRWLVAAAVAWLVVANAAICPQYLAYFNELAGGPSRGHLYLADSNIDWGQDLKRLAEYSRQHPAERIKLAYFGTADPTKYGFECTALPSFLPFDPPAVLDAGTYVVSVTGLLGVYYPLADDEIWRTGLLNEYRVCWQTLRHPLPFGVSEETLKNRRDLALYFENLRRGRLLNQLRRRPPNGRVGWSMFVYRLTQADVDAMLQP